MSDDPQPSMPTAASAPQARLRAAVAAFPVPGFAVIDGAHFDDVTALFRRDRLFARSLYLDTADPEIQAAGPWLVALDQAPDATETVFALVGDKPAAVFWCCDGGERVLWRHLRTLNMALIPQWAADGGAEPPADGSGQDPTAVTFRHYDPRVLGALMPCLDTAQFARVVGPASEIAFVAEDHGGMRRVLANPAALPSPGGMLSIRSEQIAALSARRIGASHRRIAGYLRTVADGEIGTASDAELLTHVGVSDQAGRALGLASEAAHSRWALLMLLSQGRIAEHEPTRAYLARGDEHPDRHMERLFDLTIAAMRDGRVSAGPAR